MKTIKTIALACLVSMLLTSAVYANDTDKVRNWDTFSKGLIEAMHSDNVGVQMSTLQQIALYGENLNVDELVFDIVRIYRNNKNQDVRVLALSALNAMQHDWAMDFLKRSLRFEKNLYVASHTRNVVNDYFQS